MYFIEYTVEILLIILGIMTLHGYLIKNLKTTKNNIFVITVFLLEGIFVLLSHNYIMYIFLDISVFLAYRLDKKRESILLLLINILIYNITLNLSFNYLIIYFMLLLIIILLPGNNNNKYLLFIKFFFTSLIFIKYNFETTDALLILFLIFALSYFYILLKIIYEYMINSSYLYQNENLIFELAHEVKNPIAVCKGYLDMLDVNDYQKIKKYVPIIKKEMNRSLVIMDEFLDLKRLDIKKDIMDLSMLLNDVNETMHIILKNKRIKLEIPNIEDEVIINADYDKLKQVLINLIKNSCEASSKNVEILIKYTNKYINIKIIDDGIGMNENDLKNIGKLFYTTKATGTGMGICISKEIIKLHGGELLYNSKLNKGTTVTLILPIEYIF